MSPRIRRGFAALIAATLVAIPAVANASHYRSVYSETSRAAGVVTWTLVNATETGHGDTFSSSVSVDLLSSASDAHDAGTYASLDFSEISANEDSSNSLYASTTQVYTADTSALADGIYEAFTTTGDRLSGVQNTDGGDDQVSAWIRFSMASGVPNLPPVFNSPSLYELIAPNATVTADFRATDPEGGAVTYTYLTDTTDPVLAGSAIPCSNFAAGVLTIGPAHCTNGDVFADIFNLENPAYNGDIPSWVAKVEAKDAAGNSITSDVLFRLLSAPEPEIDDDRWVGATDYELDIFAPDTETDLFRVECVNDADPTDIVTAQGASSPLTVRNLQVGAEYTCTPYAENAAGSNTGSTYSLGPVEGILLNLDLQVGVEFSGASSNIVGGGLKAESLYTLTMYSNPIEIYAGTTDINGNFNEDILIPSEACVPGVHHLILLGTDVNDQPVSDEQWVEIGDACLVLRFSDEELTPTLASTGFDVNAGIATAVALAATGLGLLAARRRRAVRS